MNPTDVAPQEQQVAVARVTIISNAEGPLTKRATLNPRGELVLTPAAELWRGSFRTVPVASVDELATIIRGLSSSEALAHGVERSGSSSGLLATRKAVESGTAQPGAIARTAESFAWPDGPGWLMLDLDLKDLPEHLRKSLNLSDAPLVAIPRLREALLAAAPCLADLPMLALPSAGAMLYRRDRRLLRGLTGVRMYVGVARAADIPELGKRLHERLMVAGWGWPYISKAGTIAVRSLVDTSVWSPERLDFIGGADCAAPWIHQARGEPQTWNGSTPARLSLDLLPMLSEAERNQLQDIVRRIRADARPEAEQARTAYVAERQRAGHPVAITYTASGEVQWLDGTHEIQLHDGTWVTVDQILAEPARHHGQRCADPLDPEGYGGDRRLATIYTQQQRTGPAIHSFAHGGATFLLRASAAADFAPLANPDGGSDSHASTTPVQLPPAPPDDRYTDMGNAGRFARANRDRVRFSGGAWLVWDGKRWAPDADGAVERLAKQVVREMYQEAAGLDDGERRKLVAWAVKSEARDRLRAMIDLARSELPAPKATLDMNPLLLNVENGTLDLETGKLRPHDPADLITRLAPLAFDASAECPTWLAFLERVFDGDRELIRYVQKAVGYSLTGDTSEHCLFLAHGTGRNGKSTFLETLRAVLWEYAKQADFSTFLVTKSTGPRNDIARLQGSRLVTASEAGAGERLAENVVKQLTGGDTITARLLYKEAVEFIPQFKIWLASNAKPEIRGNDYAVWSRIKLIPFLVTIPEEERDPQLKAKLIAEVRGILRWAVEGCLAWRQEGLGTALAVQTATEGYRGEMDWTAAFLSDTCIVAPEVWVSLPDLYAAYRGWCGGEPPGSARVFNARLASFDPARIKRAKSNGKDVWRGVELLPEAQRKKAIDTLEEALV